MSNLQYYRVFFGQRLDDTEMQKIANPQLELYLHVGLKCLQAGALLGYFGTRLGYPLMRRFNAKLPQLNAAEQNLRACRIARNWMIGGALLSVPMTYMRAFSGSFDDYAYFDRAYRLRYNSGQLNVDRASLLGGMLYGAYFANGMGSTFLMGFPKGVAWGVLLAAAYNNGNVAQEKAKEVGIAT